MVDLSEDLFEVFDVNLGLDVLDCPDEFVWLDSGSCEPSSSESSKLVGDVGESVRKEGASR